tara:strand:- start:63 stop:326 length:264 start_codon:yes stop_codon:yes gene_type:complete
MKQQKPKIHRVHESEIRQYFEMTKQMFGGKYRKLVEKFINNKNILNEMSNEDSKLFNKILYNLDFFKNVQQYQWQGMDNHLIEEGQA